MKRRGIALSVLLACTLLAKPVLVCAQAAAEEKSKPDAQAEKITPVKVQVIWEEFDGDKKVKSLPYVLSVNAGPHRDYQISKLRVGTKVPSHTGKDGALQYIDVGTNID